ncbi:uncharacterized protein [Pseudorasbora parva]|uniref:uncharacterized protein n=1 Tax=Pseudorasbora parva TaxID=51549 RepID=UPI00351E7B62
MELKPEPTTDGEPEPAMMSVIVTKTSHPSSWSPILKEGLTRCVSWQHRASLWKLLMEFENMEESPAHIPVSEFTPASPQSSSTLAPPQMLIPAALQRSPEQLMSVRLIVSPWVSTSIGFPCVSCSPGVDSQVFSTMIPPSFVTLVLAALSPSLATPAPGTSLAPTTTIIVTMDSPSVIYLGFLHFACSVSSSRATAKWTFTA